jgi:hypothetical protein
MTPREKLYYLINHYLAGEYNTKDFANQFSVIFNTERDESLSEEEEEVLEELAIVTNRFSPFEKDLAIHKAFFNEQQVRDKTQEIANKLYL